MESGEVIALYTLFEKNNIQVWIDGGWGVDALLGNQTRPHKDLDIAIQAKDVPKFRELLAAKGYKQLREDSIWNIVLRDDKGNEIDYHAFVFDDRGNVIDGIMYPTQSLSGTGAIDGYTVRCIEPRNMVKFHSGYELKEKDFQDVSALCKKFDIDLPEEYTRFIK